jgi:hypothetical protein
MQPISPALVIRAFTAAPVRVSGITLQPVTLRSWFQLESVCSPFLGYDWPADRTETLQAVCSAISALGNPGFDIDSLVAATAADDLPEVMGTIRDVIALGSSTALAMVKPGDTSKTDTYDPFGWPLRLFSFAISEMHIPHALDEPMCQIFALTAAKSFREGKVPKKHDYRTLES